MKKIILLSLLFINSTNPQLSDYFNKQTMLVGSCTALGAFGISFFVHKYYSDKKIARLKPLIQLKAFDQKEQQDRDQIMAMADHLLKLLSIKKAQITSLDKAEYQTVKYQIEYIKRTVSIFNALMDTKWLGVEDPNKIGVENFMRQEQFLNLLTNSSLEQIKKTEGLKDLLYEKKIN